MCTGKNDRDVLEPPFLAVSWCEIRTGFDSVGQGACLSCGSDVYLMCQCTEVASNIKSPFGRRRLFVNA